MTKIEWADLTINPVVGCSKCSPGCDNCYAEKFAARLAKNPATAAKYAGVVDEQGRWTGKIFPWSLGVFGKLPKKASRVFIGSMTDMFHENLDFGYVGEVLYHTAREYPQHTFMLLTKRAHRLGEFHEWTQQRKWDFMPLPNLWLGVTVCNQAEADAKIPVLLQTPAARRFVSVEPMLGPVNLTRYLEMEERIYQGDDTSGFLDYEPMLHWVIAGGETGPHARPMHPDWVRSLRDQCQAAEVPFFFKSWGEWLPCSGIPVDIDFDVDKYPWGFIGDDGIFDCGNDGAFECRNGVCGEQTYHVGKKRAGRSLDGREWNEVPGEDQIQAVKE